MSASARKVDFLRHIVNRILAENNAPRQIVEDVRKLVGKAEDTYKFSAFGGSVERLADYLRSRDFDELIALFKSANMLEILVKILEEAKQKYSHIPTVVQAIEERLKEIKVGEEDKEAKIKAAFETLRSLSDLGLKVELDKGKVRVSDHRGLLSVVVGYDPAKKTYVVDYEARGKLSIGALGTLLDSVKKLLSVVRELQQG